MANQSVPNKFLLLATLATVVLTRKIYIFMGQIANTMDVYKVFVYPDYNFDSTIIFKNDFECTEQKHCIHESEPKTMVYNGHTLTYYDAYAQMNMLPQAFVNPLRFRYVIDSKSKLPSIVGFSRSSEFLTYLAQQDFEKNRNLIFKLDWEHNMLIKGDIIKTDKLPVSTGMTGTVILQSPGKMKTADLKVCYTNTLDLFDKSPSIIGVRQSEFPYWKEFLNESLLLAEEKGSTLMYNLTLYLFDHNGVAIGHTEFKVDEFFGDNEHFLVKPFTDDYDQGRGCDIYTGSILLRKHNFEYFYREIANGEFEALFSYDGFHGYRADSRIRTKSHFEMDMLFFAGCFVIAGYLIYEHMLKRKYGDDDNEDDEERQPVELEDTQEKHFTFGANNKKRDTA
jgi:hypothetical protein